MSVDGVKGFCSGMVVARGALGAAAALSGISALALPIVKAVGWSLLGATAGFVWPVTLGIMGGLVIVAIIAFVAYKVLDGTEEGSKELIDIEERATERKRQADVVHENLLNQSLSGSDKPPTPSPDSTAEIPFMDVVDVGPKVELRKRLEKQEYTPEKIDKVFEHFKNHENFQLALQNEDYAFLLGLAITAL